MNEAVKIKELVDVLEALVKGYRELLKVVRSEKEFLIAADIDGLNQNNDIKETVIFKIKQVEQMRLTKVREMGLCLGMDLEEPLRLLEIAKQCKEESADRLRKFHSVLTLLLGRIKEINKQNELLAKTALQNVTGAIKSIKGDISNKTTYKKQGDKRSSGELTGRLVQKQV